MDRNQHNLCSRLLKRLEDAGVLKHIVLVGSWCMPCYSAYFSKIDYRPLIRTRDIDLLIPLPHKMMKTVDVESLLKDLNFVINFKGSSGYMQFVHSDIMLEFLVPERGRGTDKPYNIPELGINAAAIRYLDFLAGRTIKAHLGGVEICVPHPVNFCLHKLMICKRRGNSVKSENDRRQGVYILRCLIEMKELDSIRKAAAGMPVSWQKLIKTSLVNTADEDLNSQVF